MSRKDYEMSSELKLDGKYFAQALLNVKGFYYCTEPPFVSASGLKEPIYSDHRLLMAHPDMVNNIANGMVKLIKKNYDAPDIIVGVATSALPYATLVSQKLDLPLAYVRPREKDHGRRRLVEGLISDGAKAIIVEDVLVLGISSMNAYNAVVAQGAKVLGIVSIYNLKLARLESNLRKMGVRNYSLYDLDILMQVVAAKKYFDMEKIRLIAKWRENPYDFFEKYYKSEIKR